MAKQVLLQIPLQIRVRLKDFADQKGKSPTLKSLESSLILLSLAPTISTFYPWTIVRTKTSSLWVERHRSCLLLLQRSRALKLMTLPAELHTMQTPSSILQQLRMPMWASFIFPTIQPIIRTIKDEKHFWYSLTLGNQLLQLTLWAFCRALPWAI